MVEINIKLSSGGYTSPGGRDHNEDTYVIMEDCNAAGGKDDGKRRMFAGIFDGHGGGFVSRWCKDNMFAEIAKTEGWKNDDYEAALKEGFSAAEKEMAASGNAQRCGTTALCCILVDNKLYVANTGDCRCVIVKRGTEFALTRDHDPGSPEEKARIEALGGSVDIKTKKRCFCLGSYVDSGAATRVLPGKLAVARSIGDFSIKAKHDPPLIIPDPDFYTYDIDEKTVAIIFSTDGVWGPGGGQLGLKDTCGIVRGTLNSWDPVADKGTSRADQVARNVVEKALNSAELKNITCDNTTTFALVPKEKK